MSEAKTPIHQCECKVCQGGADPATVRHHQQLNLLLSRYTEPQRRWYVGFLSQEADGPSDRQLSLITGLDPKTIRRGRHELDEGLADLPPGRQRRTGGGRQSVQKKRLSSR